MDVVQSDAVVAGRPFRVLVVDDDPGIRRMIVAALKRDHYQFFEAPNGRDALEIMRVEHPDVVVLDLMMPILSGWDVLREREHDIGLRQIPVIIVSANRDPEIATDAVELTARSNSPLYHSKSRPIGLAETRLTLGTPTFVPSTV